ncbi:hydroxymethylglutaryl-CoA lyase [Martelella mediterranea]|uniref:hydroxymethylglutaryl-CoA lyase n=1 Tax=Martelella mediterranea DSM 17316 TaxID=1122214 RepID=A0A1U9YWR4_9HYPH|nr:hydroxymethylglutaryl-CoA lyase [Martelella mediterranea]AQZ49878.1 Hydroxymethylglutaryl-CoA lyase YngG [Martelella mediterranea DSM 17316]
MSDHVRIYEVGPRDGLQNEDMLIPAERKVALIDLLSQAGFEKIEATSFVSPKWVPQLADAEAVLAGITRKPGTDYAALTPNMKGYERALAAGVDEVAVFASASEGFSRKNINCSIAESLVRFAPLLDAAKSDGVPVRGYVSCVIACPYDGPVASEAVRDVAQALFDMGCYEVSLGDTIGAGTPESVATMLETVLPRLPAERLAGHFHDTRDNALDNVMAALALGLRVFDSAVGGLGGCPYAPGAKGNLATGPLVALLEQSGFSTGIDREALAKAEQYLRSITASA